MCISMRVGEGKLKYVPEITKKVEAKTSYQIRFRRCMAYVATERLLPANLRHRRLPHYSTTNLSFVGIRWASILRWKHWTASFMMVNLRRWLHVRREKILDLVFGFSSSFVSSSLLGFPFIIDQVLFFKLLQTLKKLFKHVRSLVTEEERYNTLESHPNWLFFFFFSIDYFQLESLLINHFLVNCFCIFYRWEISLLISYVFVNLTSHTLELKLNNLWYNNFAIIAMRRIMDWVPTHGNVNAMGNHLCFGVSTLVSFA